MSTAATTDKATIPVRIITPEGVLYDEPVRMVVAPSVQGDVAILARHAPLEAFLRVGETRVRLADADETLLRFATTGGYMSVEGDGVLILVEQGERLEDIDRERAEAALVRADEKLATLGAEDEADRIVAEAAKARAENRLRVSAPE
jgi:F-type H+-transporting ATPase subunit epsilon